MPVYALGTGFSLPLPLSLSLPLLSAPPPSPSLSNSPNCVLMNISQGVSPRAVKSLGGSGKAQFPVPLVVEGLLSEP